MELFSLRSGSRGNAALVFTDKTKVMVDCGISGKTTACALCEIGVNSGDLNGIVVTHEHSDHISGIGILMRRYNLPVFANRETWDAMSSQIGKVDKSLVNIIDENQNFKIGDIEITPFAIPHDAINPVGYTFTDGEEKVSVATDIGELKKDLFQALRGSKTVLLEANHDTNMLEIGAYPLPLKRRIRGCLGHLSNDDAAKAAEFLVRLGTKNILLGHLSEENNYPELAIQTVRCALEEAGIKLGEDVIVKVAEANSSVKA